MTSTLTSKATDFFYMNLHRYNDSAENIPARVFLDNKEDLLSNISGWQICVLKFTASLGSDSLFFLDAQPNATIDYFKLNPDDDVDENALNLRNVTGILRENCDLGDKSYSFQDIFKQLNPKFHGEQQIGFRLENDGRIKFINEKQSQEKDNRYYDVTMSTQLAQLLEIDDQPIHRLRRANNEYAVAAKMLGIVSDTYNRLIRQNDVFVDNPNGRARMHSLLVTNDNQQIVAGQAIFVVNLGIHYSHFMGGKGTIPEPYDFSKTNVMVDVIFNYDNANPLFIRRCRILNVTEIGVMAYATLDAVSNFTGNIAIGTNHLMSNPLMSIISASFFKHFVPILSVSRKIRQRTRDFPFKKNDKSEAFYNRRLHNLLTYQDTIYNDIIVHTRDADDRPTLLNIESGNALVRQTIQGYEFNFSRFSEGAEYIFHTAVRIGVDIDIDRELKFAGNVRFPATYGHEYIQQYLYEPATRLYEGMYGPNLDIVQHTESGADLHIIEIDTGLKLFDNLIIQSFLQLHSIDEYRSLFHDLITEFRNLRITFPDEIELEIPFEVEHIYEVTNDEIQDAFLGSLPLAYDTTNVLSFSKLTDFADPVSGRPIIETHGDSYLKIMNLTNAEQIEFYKSGSVIASITHPNFQIDCVANYVVEPIGGDYIKLIPVSSTNQEQNQAFDYLLNNIDQWSRHHTKITARGFSINGRIYDEDLVHSSLATGPQSKVRFGPGDFVRSKRPISDSLQNFTKILLTSSDGFMFSPELNMAGARKPVLCSFDIPNSVGVSANQQFENTGISTSPYGDVSFTSTDPSPHKFNTSAPLRNGSLNFELMDRKGNVVNASLPPRGRIDILLGFFKF